MKKILIPTKLEAVAREILEAHGNYQVVQEVPDDPIAFYKSHPDAYAMIVRSEKITDDIMDLMPGLKVIVRAGSGYDNIDINYARKRGIDVMNTPGANANAVAEEVIALMLADARHIIAADASTRAGKWEKNNFMGREITGKTIGIVGLGYIGQMVARRLSGFDVTLLGYDPILSHERADEMSVELVNLPDLFARSDYVTLHIPENDETRKMVNADLLGRMRPNATLINCARAGIIDEEALRRVKSERKIRFLNDVYPKDAVGPKQIADIADIMLPHLGANTVEANTNAARRAAEELIALDESGITSFIVNRAVPEGLNEAYGRLAFIITKLCRHLLGPGTQLKALETSFYGSLAPFSDWLITPVVTALSDKLDQPLDRKSAHKYLKNMGITYNNRKTDPRKKFNNSLTVDLIASLNSGNLRRISVRGTVAEGTLMVARINDFDQLYFEPRGPTLFFMYNDRPGVLGQIGIKLAQADINIEDTRNPHHAKSNESLAILRVNKAVPAEVLDEISNSIQALSAVYYDFG